MVRSLGEKKSKSAVKMRLSLGLVVLSEAKTVPQVGLVTVNSPACIGCDNAAQGQFPWQVSLQISMCVKNP